MPTVASTKRVEAPLPTNVAELLGHLKRAELIKDKTFALATVELDLKRSVSPGVAVLLDEALRERIQHGGGDNRTADDALLIINTVRGDWVGGKPDLHR